MAMQVEDQRVRPRAMWFLLPATMWIVAIALFAVAVGTLIHIVNSGIDRIPTVQTPSSGGAVSTAILRVPADGLTLYTTVKSSDATCTLLPSGTGEQVSLESFSFDLNITRSGRTYYGLGVTPKSMAAGSYGLRCIDAVSGERFGTGLRIDTTALATRFLWGFALPLGLGLAGLAILIVLIVRRHSAKTRLRARQAYAGPGYGGGWNTPYSPSSPPPPPPPARPGPPAPPPAG